MHWNVIGISLEFDRNCIGCHWNSVEISLGLVCYLPLPCTWPTAAKPLLLTTGLTLPRSLPANFTGWNFIGVSLEVHWNLEFHLNFIGISLEFHRSWSGIQPPRAEVSHATARHLAHCCHATAEPLIPGLALPSSFPANFLEISLEFQWDFI